MDGMGYNPLRSPWNQHRGLQVIQSIRDQTSWPLFREGGHLTNNHLKGWRLNHRPKKVTIAELPSDWRRFTHSQLMASDEQSVWRTVMFSQFQSVLLMSHLGMAPIEWSAFLASHAWITRDRTWRKNCCDWLPNRKNGEVSMSINPWHTITPSKVSKLCGSCTLRIP